VNAQFAEDVVRITLSKSNLLALLHKLEKADSAQTIHKRIDGVLVIVSSQSDLDHYKGEERGQMTEDTEAFIASWGTK
jgi:hypothetical protein